MWVQTMSGLRKHRLDPTNPHLSEKREELELRGEYKPPSYVSRLTIRSQLKSKI